MISSKKILRINRLLVDSISTKYKNRYESRERHVWNNLRARHYAVLTLLAIILLETSAIAIDKFISRDSVTAYEIDCSFQNNAFLREFQLAELGYELPVEMVTSTELAARREAKAAVAAAAAGSVAGEGEAVAAQLPIKLAAVPVAESYIEYAIQPGDSLSSIAVRFGAETQELMRLNGLDNSHVIRAGSVLKVPTTVKEIQYVVRRGDSLSRIASRFKVSLQDIIEANNLKSHVLLADQSLVIPTVTTIKGEAVVQNQASTEVKLMPSQNVQVAVAPASKPDLRLIDKEAVKLEAQKEAAAARASMVAVVEPVVPAAKPEVVAVVADASESDAEVSPEVKYTIKAGDSLLKLAHQFNTTVAQIQHDNNMSGTLVKVGQSITVSPNKKLYRVVSKPITEKENQTKVVNHKIASGESLSVIAKKYNTTVGSIVAHNNLKSTVVIAGKTLKVPTNSDYKVTSSVATVNNGTWRRPTRGQISSPYGWRIHPIQKKRSFHAGIDIAAPKGTPILASKSGKIIYAGRRAGYGNLIIVSHADGYSTRYAHCSSIVAKKGQQVKAGQLIGRVGATGMATGNHLHFEIRKNGNTLNPFSHIK
jgi:murein DD-endopeptidase MepM/ murein hydrolase activator NlpD